MDDPVIKKSTVSKSKHFLTNIHENVFFFFIQRLLQDKIVWIFQQFSPPIFLFTALFGKFYLPNRADFHLFQNFLFLQKSLQNRKNTTSIKKLPKNLLYARGLIVKKKLFSSISIKNSNTFWILQPHPFSWSSLINVLIKKFFSL